jgi:hypothetical protein
VLTVRQEIDTERWKRRASRRGDQHVMRPARLREGRWETATGSCTLSRRRKRAAYRLPGSMRGSALYPERPLFCWARTTRRGGNPLLPDELGAGEAVAAVFRKSRLPAGVTVTALAASGETASYETILAYEGPVWSEAQVSTRITGIPAACYSDDRVHPIIRIRTTAADGLPYELSATSSAQTARAPTVWSGCDRQGMGARLSVRNQRDDARLAGRCPPRVEINRGAARFCASLCLSPTRCPANALCGDDFIVLSPRKRRAGDRSKRRPLSGTNAWAARGVIMGTRPPNANAERRAGNRKLETKTLCRVWMCMPLSKARVLRIPCCCRLPR